MARENQGLHIALIIFVMLTVILSVTTFLFFREYQDATLRANEAEQNQKDSDQAARDIQDEANRYKAIIGWSATDNRPDIEQSFNTDMDTYANVLTHQLQDAEKSYRKVLEILVKELGDVNAQLDDALVKNRQWEATVKQLRGVYEPQVATYKQNMDDMQKDYTDERTKLNQSDAARAQRETQMQAALQKSQQDAQTRYDDLNGKLATANQEITNLQKALIQKTDRLDQVDRPSFDVADGKIRWVNQRNQTVWINLGRGDKLPNMTTFAVYDAEINDITAAKKKADIQVIQLLGEHLAEARIVEDDLADPIMPGDLIHTPIWAPGQQEHLALTDGLDIDGDGKSDLQVIRNLITMAGGVVDAWLDEEGNLHGSMDGNTRFLVVGLQHDHTTDPTLRDARKDMLNKAEALGVRPITLQDLLNRTGWREETPVVTYGRGANPADFRATHPEGAVPRSTGNVFKPRTPARSSGRSAF
jgi:hypothetical protein